MNNKSTLPVFVAKLFELIPRGFPIVLKIKFLKSVYLLTFGYFSIHEEYLQVFYSSDSILTNYQKTFMKQNILKH